MERQFTEQETKAIYEAEAELRKLGLIVFEADADSVDDITHNTNLIIAWYSQNPGTPLTVQSMCEVAEHLRGQLRWMSASQLRYISSYESLSESKKAQFGQYWNMASTRHTLVQTGDPGFENCVALIEWARGRDFTIETFNTALSNLSAQGKLHLQPVRTTQRRGHSDDRRGFMSREDTNVSAVERARRDRERNEQNRQQTETAPADAPDAWCRIIRGQLADGTHGQQQASKELFERLSAEGYQPRQISAELSKLQRSYQRLFSSTAV